LASDEGDDPEREREDPRDEAVMLHGTTVPREALVSQFEGT
jgi:hypothetical protein